MRHVQDDSDYYGQFNILTASYHPGTSLNFNHMPFAAFVVTSPAG